MNLTIGIPIGLILGGLAWYLVAHKEHWQYRQIILGIIIGLVGLGGAVGATVDGAVSTALSTGSAAVVRMFNAAVGG